MRLLSLGIVLLGMLLVGGLAPVLAQEVGKETGKGAPMAQYRLRRAAALARQLRLTEEQKVRIREIVRRSREQARQIREDTSLTPEQKRERLRELRRSTRQEISSVLTPEQREKMRRLWAWRWRQWQRWRAWMDTPRIAPPFGKLWRLRDRGGWGKPL